MVQQIKYKNKIFEWVYYRSASELELKKNKLKKTISGVVA